MKTAIKFVAAGIFFVAAISIMGRGPDSGSLSGGWGVAANVAWLLDSAIVTLVSVAFFAWAVRDRKQGGEVRAGARPGDAGERPRSSLWAPVLITASVSFVVFSTTVWLVVSAGLNNAYSYEVVDQEARAAQPVDVATGVYDVVDASYSICGDGDAYQACAFMHAAMWETACADRELSIQALMNCSQLRSFVDETTEEANACGSGCYTVAEDGRWGWNYYKPVAEFQTVYVDALPEVTHEEHCYFSLGAIEIGACNG